MNYSKTLILNVYYQPLILIQHHEALTKLFSNRFNIILDDFTILTFHQWLSNQYSLSSINLHISSFINTPTNQLLIPNTIISKSNSTNILSIENKCYKNLIFLRDKYRCQYCGKKLSKEELTLDHVIPKSQGGSESFTNLVTCCSTCNTKKGNKLLSSTNMKLLRQPSKISFYQVLKYRCKSFPLLWKYKWNKFFN